jgi:hypothetical protein
MAKRSRPDPQVTHRWKELLRNITLELNHQKGIYTEIEERRNEAVRGAFGDGVLVGDLQEVTDLSGSRLFQIKFEHRGNPSKAG